MTKRKARFRTATRTDNGYAAKLHEGWEIMTGLPVNESRWFAYRQVFAKGYQTWYLIEGRTGLNVQCANTLKEAVNCFLRDEVKVTTWCGLAANQQEVGTLPLWEDTATEEEQQWES